MKSYIKILFILVTLQVFWASEQSDFFSDINSNNQEESNLELDVEESSQKLKLDKGFWDQEVKKDLVDNFHKEVKIAKEPSFQDLRIVFDDQVIRTFSDHLLTKNLDQVYGLYYHMVGDLFRISVILDYQALNVDQNIDNFVKPKDFDARVEAGDKYLLAVDLVCEVFSKEEELDSLFLKVTKINNYRFWKDGNKENENIQKFKNYVEKSSKSQETENFSKMLEKLEEEINKAQEEEDFKKAFLLQKQLSEIQELQKMEVGFELSPEFIGNSIKLLQSLDAISQALGFDYTFYKGENSSDSLHLIQVSQLSQVFKMALPDFQVSYVRTKNSKVYFMGKILDAPSLNLK